MQKPKDKISKGDAKEVLITPVKENKGNKGRRMKVYTQVKGKVRGLLVDQSLTRQCKSRLPDSS